jgi:hypothetical protein
MLGDVRYALACREIPHTNADCFGLLNVMIVRVRDRTTS